jgi:hypothetical protein
MSVSFQSAKTRVSIKSDAMASLEVKPFDSLLLVWSWGGVLALECLSIQGWKVWTSRKNTHGTHDSEFLIRIGRFNMCMDCWTRDFVHTFIGYTLAKRQHSKTSFTSLLRGWGWGRKTKMISIIIYIIIFYVCIYIYYIYIYIHKI